MDIKIWIIIGVTIAVVLLGSALRVIVGDSNPKRELVALGLMFIILTPVGIIAWKVGETLGS